MFASKRVWKVITLRILLTVVLITLVVLLMYMWNDGQAVLIGEVFLDLNSDCLSSDPGTLHHEFIVQKLGGEF